MNDKTIAQRLRNTLLNSTLRARESPVFDTFLIIIVSRDSKRALKGTEISLSS